jgi:hypothetical protein
MCACACQRTLGSRGLRGYMYVWMGAIIGGHLLCGCGDAVLTDTVLGRNADLRDSLGSWLHNTMLPTHRMQSLCLCCFGFGLLCHPLFATPWVLVRVGVHAGCIYVGATHTTNARRTRNISAVHCLSIGILS